MTKEAENQNIETPAGELGTNEVTDAASTEEGSQEAETPQVQESPTFSHPSLTGKTEAEVAAYVSLLEDTAREQAGKLNEAERLRQETIVATDPTPPTGAQEVDFFTAPEEAIERRTKPIEQGVEKLRQEMHQMMMPFQSDMANQQMLSEFGSEWTRYKPMVDQLVQSSGGNPANVDLLRNFFYTVKGYVAHTGQSDAALTTTPASTPAPPAQSTAPPQHRPSAAPMARPPGTGTRLRELTENERTLAREMGMTPEEYLYWADLDETEVATAKGPNNG